MAIPTTIANLSNVARFGGKTNFADRALRKLLEGATSPEIRTKLLDSFSKTGSIAKARDLVFKAAKSQKGATSAKGLSTTAKSFQASSGATSALGLGAVVGAGIAGGLAIRGAKKKFDKENEEMREDTQKRGDELIQAARKQRQNK